MKRILFLVMICLTTILVKAQTIESVKTLLLLNKYKDAKVEVDKGMANPKFTSKAEAYMLKVSIYAGLAMEDAVKNTAAGDQLANEADAAFKKYKEMDPAMTLVNDPAYQNGMINLYSLSLIHISEPTRL